MRKTKSSINYSDKVVYTYIPSIWEVEEGGLQIEVYLDNTTSFRSAQAI
jgi:hypothetical protein